MLIHLNCLRVLSYFIMYKHYSYNIINKIKSDIININMDIKLIFTININVSILIFFFFVDSHWYNKYIPKYSYRNKNFVPICKKKRKKNRKKNTIDSIEMLWLGYIMRVECFIYFIIFNCFI